MIARHEGYMDKADIWAKLAAPLPSGVVSWRQDGKIIARDGRYFARYVAYVDANTVRERLDGVVPGEWDLTLDLLPALPSQDEEGNLCSFKARLQILGVIREDVGTGRDYKAAATDAFKRAAVRFGIAHELYAYEQNWVQMDGDGRYAKPLEDPQTAYTRRYGTPAAAAPASENGEAEPAAVAAVRPSRRRQAAARASEAPAADAGVADVLAARDAEVPSCPKCGGRMWDNRLSKRNPKAPDFKCRDRGCDGVIWPARAPQGATAGAAAERGSNAGPLVDVADDAPTASEAADDLPF
ncbi:MAG TPA: Rad52/Rad22 family DNA repair protein [Gemmatimonadaceae bacterium]|nr:Rad52/Rad22 family DNA repair protein [Gemmatimonadaceae bacterium]